jgi:hypothetical protein
MIIGTNISMISVKSYNLSLTDHSYEQSRYHEPQRNQNAIYQTIDKQYTY